MPQFDIPACLSILDTACKLDSNFAADVASYFGSGGGDTSITLYAMLAEAQCIVLRQEKG